ncbi:NAD(P)-dependent oxidoreductase [Actinomyces massiliensis]|uniref:NADP oxidoreductase coenzyme F420-dependent n=1 Tax=Actinomyces massiliensis F0489 TaxID=1125718 RepID=J0XE68_9ACTO|nr:NAD(P)-dependent oxidoreductase [Actinomyces massiliensis]EJF47016.1 NADP oxidoreductase coenzyme F420-dependent [Actinomyces massiliensis F0489]WLD72063.1 NAD(P)-dependent oxidoreductase [Actinomyces massiliensis]
MTTAAAVAVLGLGAMGLPMATNLARRFPVRGFDVIAERRALAERAGITPAGTAAEAVADADVVLIAVRDQAQLEELLFGEVGEVGIAPHMARGAVVLLTSTVGGAGVRAVAPRLAEAGLRLVDAPVSGGPARAGDGDLLVVVGADDDAWAAAEAVLEVMASTLVRVGDAPGDGQAMKTVNQLLCGVHIAATGEALALARALGLDAEVALKALMSGAASSFMLGDRGPRMLQAYDEDAGGPHDVEVRATLNTFVKDMGIVSSAAKGAGLSTPVAAAAEQLYLQGAAHGLGDRDDSSVITVVAPPEKD